MMENNFVVAERQVTLTRVFDAPRELVFRAYTDPSLIPRWWGPRRFTTTVDRMDVRPGGKWRFVQRDSGGNEYAFNGVYKEIAPYERLSDTFEFEGMPGHVLVETAVFEEHGGKTKVTGTAAFSTDEDRDMMLNTGMQDGWSETMDRMAELLQELKGGAAGKLDL